MFGLFKKKTQKEKLTIKYENLLREYHKFSSTNRKMADLKMAEAQAVLQELDKL